MMLNTDMELAYDIDVDNTGKGTQCKIGNGEDESRCSKSSTHTFVAIYANVREYHTCFSSIIIIKLYWLQLSCK